MPQGPDEIAYWLEAAEARAYADIFRAVAVVAPELGAAVLEDGPTTTFMLSALNVGFFNRSLGLGIGEPATDAAIDAVLRAFEAAGQTSFTIQVSPFARPSAIETMLEAHGRTRGRRWVKLWRDTEDPPAPRTDLRIEKIGAAQDAEWASVILEAFEIPEVVRPFATATLGRQNWHHYLAYDGDSAVGGAAMHLADGVAWLGFGGTRPSHRGRGSQSGLFARRIADAARLGASLLITETGEETPDEPNPSYRNMLRAGFRLAYPRQNWL